MIDLENVEFVKWLRKCEACGEYKGLERFAGLRKMHSRNCKCCQPSHICKSCTGHSYEDPVDKWRVVGPYKARNITILKPLTPEERESIA